jgi:hypothetical protein
VIVRLDTFRYIPRPNGWETPRLHFGNLFTVLEGLNGSGKTPVMKGIMQAMGHEIDLPPEITDNCAAAELGLLIDGKPHTVLRPLQKEFRIRITSADETLDLSQPEYAQWFSEKLGGDPRVLTTKQDKPTQLYANLIIPAFAVDQDRGFFTDYYVPKDRDFIKSQRQEVIRFLLGVQPRYPFRTRTDYDEAKESLERAEKALDLQRYVMDRLRKNDELRDDEEPRLLARRAALQAELAVHGQAIEAIRDITSFVEADIVRLEAERDALRNSARNLSRQKGQLSLVLSELDGEAEILGANVEATDVLRHLCGNTDCALFANATKSYGRSLLYLRDQTKDLRASAADIDRSEASANEQLTLIEQAIAAKRQERAERVAASPQGQLMAKLNALTNEIVSIELRLATWHQYVAERAKFEKLLDRHTQAVQAVETLRPKTVRGDTDTAEDARKQLTESMQERIQTLRTQNTRTAGFDEDFIVQIDGKRFSTDTHHSGSTRARIVLAFHAAILEVALTRGGNHPGWLILDAPRQHELNQEDFNAYADRLKALGDRYPGRVQVVFSVANLKTQIELTSDELWVPAYQNAEGEPRFLGSIRR